MLSQDLSLQLTELIRRLLEDRQLDLVEISVKRQNRRLLIEVFADKPRGGITVDECASLNKQIGDELEEANLVEDSYLLSVSSPGLDRPLTTDKDFLRVIGKEVRIHMAEDSEGQREYAGFVKDVAEGRVRLQAKDGECYVPLEKIRKALQII